MPEAALHSDEPERLKALQHLDILDTPPEEAYDDIAKLAAELCNAPIGVVSLVDEDRQWFKAIFGLDVRETPRCQAFCAHAINNPRQPLVISDATIDPRFADNPLVNGAPNIRFYAGVPLLTADTHMPVGTLCVISDQVMTIDDRQLKSLSILASHVEKLLHLRAASQQLQQRDALINASHDAIFSWTNDEGILSWNRGAELTYGFSCDEALGKVPHLLLQTSDLQTLTAFPSLDVGDDWVGELNQKKHSGDPITVSTRLQRFAMGQHDVFLETSRDITEQKRKERDLYRAQTSLDTAADAVFWLREGNGDIFYVNDSACRQLKYSRDELLSMNIADIDPSIRSPEAMEIVRKRTKKNESNVFQTTHIDKHGTAIPVEVAAHIVEFANEMLACTFVRDISDRVATRQKLEDLSAELQLFFEAIPIGVAFADAERQITRVNPAFAAIFGYSESEVIGQETSILYANQNDFAEQGRQRFNPTASAKMAPYEIDYRRRDGSVFTSEMIGAPVTGEDGTIVGYLGLIQDISDRVSTRKRMEEINEDRRAMVELLGTTDEVWSWRVGTQECDYAPGFRRLLGFDGDDVSAFPNLLQPFHDRIHPDDSDELWRVANQSLSQRTPFFHEFRLRHADDSYIWVRSRANTIYTDSGEPTKMVGTTHDITDIKSAESEREHFFNAGIQLYGIADISTANWIRASSNWVETLGWSSEELVGSSYLEAAHPDDHPQYLERMRQLLDGKPVIGFMGRMRHKDGSYRTLEWNVSPPEPGETIVYFTARDVSDADHAVVRKIADAVPMTMYVYDIKRQRNVFINRHIVSLLGYSVSEAMKLGDRFLQTLIHADDLPRIQSHFQQIDRGRDDQRFEIEYRMKAKSGEYRSVYCVNRIFLRSSDGSVQQIVGTATLLDDLEVLRRYARDLEIANSDLEEFAYVASHDLKQPLRGIDNLAKWIAEDSKESLLPVARGHLEKLRGRVARMERLLDDLLTYSRVGRRPVDPEKVDVGQLVGELSDLLSPPASFRVECQGQMPIMTTERIPFEQVLRNLIGNAIKHRSRDNGCVTVSANRDGDFMEFSVRDDGPGIAQEFHDRIFRMFHTLRPRDEMEASGMGLALAKKLVESHGGTIGVESVEGQGSEFQFTWPN